MLECIASTHEVAVVRVLVVTEVSVLVVVQLTRRTTRTALGKNAGLVPRGDGWGLRRSQGIYGPRYGI